MMAVTDEPVGLISERVKINQPFEDAGNGSQHCLPLQRRGGIRLRAAVRVHQRGSCLLISILSGFFRETISSAVLKVLLDLVGRSTTF